MSKGHRQRPRDERYCSAKDYDENWEKAFGKPEEGQIKSFQPGQVFEGSFQDDGSITIGPGIIGNPYGTTTIVRTGIVENRLWENSSQRTTLGQQPQESWPCAASRSAHTRISVKSPHSPPKPRSETGRLTDGTL